MKHIILTTLIFLTSSCDAKSGSYFERERKLTNEEYLDIKKDIQDLKRPDWREADERRKINIIIDLLQYTDDPPTIIVGNKKIVRRWQPNHKIEVEDVP